MLAGTPVKNWRIFWREILLPYALTGDNCTVSQKMSHLYLAITLTNMTNFDNLAEMLLRKQTIKRCFIFPPMLYMVLFVILFVRSVHEVLLLINTYCPWRPFYGALQERKYIFLSTCLKLAFSALTLLIGWQEGHPACKNWVVRYWHGCLSGARCRWFAYGPADATATRSSLAPVKSRIVYISGAGLPRLSWKKGH